MKNSTIETTAFTNDCLAEPMRRAMALDHDIPELAIGFGRQRTKQPRDFGTTTHGEVTFRRVDPLREPFEVADARLRTRLEALCETLRAKY